MVKVHMEMSTLAIREMQTDPQWGLLHTYQSDSNSAGKDAEEQIPHMPGKCKTVQPLWERVWQCLVETKPVLSMESQQVHC